MAIYSHRKKDPLAALTVLHDIGADMKMVTRHRQTALHLVASSCSPGQLESTIKFLIKNDVDPQQIDDEGKTMLHYINERNDIPRRQKEQISTLVNPYQNGPFSPRARVLMLATVIKAFIAQSQRDLLKILAFCIENSG